MAYYDDETVDEAVDAYYAWHKAQGTPENAINAPGRYDTERDDAFVYIRNVNGDLARYSIAEHRILNPDEWEASA